MVITQKYFNSLVGLSGLLAVHPLGWLYGFSGQAHQQWQQKKNNTVISTHRRRREISWALGRNATEGILWNQGSFPGDFSSLLRRFPRNDKYRQRCHFEPMWDGLVRWRWEISWESIDGLKKKGLLKCQLLSEGISPRRRRVEMTSNAWGGAFAEGISPPYGRRNDN